MSKQGGVFQIDREIFDNPIWENVVEFRLFFYIVGHAVWSDEPVIKGGIQVNRGQFLRSYRNLREDLRYFENHGAHYYGLATIQRTVEKLVHDERLIIETTEQGTLFTVVNYEIYQGFERFKNEDLEHSRNTRGTLAEHSRNNKKKDNKDNNILFSNENNNTGAHEEDPKPKSKVKTKPKTEPALNKSEIQAAIEAKFPQPEVREALMDFAEHREQKGDPLNALKLKILLNKLAKPQDFPTPEIIVERIGDAIIGNWASVYPPKDFGNKPKPQKDTNYYDPIEPGKTWQPGEMTMIQDFDQDK